MNNQEQKQANTTPTPYLLNVQQISDGWIKKYLLSYRLPDGSEIEYESVSRKDLEGYTRELTKTDTTTKRADAISIVGRTTSDEILLIKEFRYPLNSWCIAFPAGLVEEGESIFSCAQRELQEETGYSIITEEGRPKMHPLSQPGYSSTGMSEESVHIVYAYVEKTGEPKPEPKEFIETFTVKIEDIPRFIRENTIPMGTRSQLILEAFIQDMRWDECEKSPE
ncbi:MAG: NUDIX hydrolase [Raoultibacter sp.]|jgi:ADP-ribose pyrophosphatase